MSTSENKEQLFQDNYQPLFDHLERIAFLKAWQTDLSSAIKASLTSKHWNVLPDWVTLKASLNELDIDPSVAAEVILDHPSVKVTGASLESAQTQKLKQLLQTLKPWRKGPFDLLDISIDTEWRSDMKWGRIAPHLPSLKGKRILDVGCGNGYYLWRMLGAGAQLAIGIDPSCRYVLQWALVKQLLELAKINTAEPNLPAYVLPIGVEALPEQMDAFDLSFSMGVLYHRKSPIEHLVTMKNTLKPGGTLILETLVVEGGIDTVLVPNDRYAQMPNVWFLPSTAALTVWLKRCKFKKVEVVDLAPTTTEEQRSTEWIDTHSLSHFLDPNDPGKTIEGYPAPLRATILATR